MARRHTAVVALLGLLGACSPERTAPSDVPSYSVSVQLIEGVAPAATSAGEFRGWIPGHALHWRGSRDGIELRQQGGGTSRLRLTGLARGHMRMPLPPVEALGVEGTSLVFDRGIVREWYRAGPLGLEQGLTIDVAPLPPADRGELRIEVALEGAALTARHAADRVEVLDASGTVLFAVRELRVIDASGRELASALETVGAGLRYRIDDRTATYPLQIDPIFETVTTLAPSTTGGTNVGAAVAVLDEVAAIGAPGDASGAGAVFMYGRDGTGWTQTSKLVAADSSSGARFGASLAFDGDLLAIGAPSKGKGAVYVFRRGTTWTQLAKLEPSDGAAGDGFGRAVSLSGTRLLVGAPGHDTPVTDVGTAYVYELVGTAFALAGKLTPGSYGAGDAFGSAVAIDGATAVVGAPSRSHGGVQSGTAFVYERGGDWTLKATLRPSVLADFDRFGASVAVRDARVLVGAPSHNAGAKGGGAVFVFEREPSGWNESALLRPRDYAPDKSFGSALSLHEDYVVVGAPLDAIAGSFVGSAYVFQSSPEGWLEVTKLRPVSSSAYGYFGRSVAAGRDTLVIGAPQSSTSTATDVGVAHAFRNARAGVNGVACTSSLECASGHCADGVCCDSACTETCVACTAAKKSGGADGACGPVAAKTDPDDECPREPEFTCGFTGVCDGSGACELFPAGTTCGPTQCIAGVFSTYTCSGAACTASKTPCGSFGCDPSTSACRTSCTVDADCNPAARCEAGTCIDKLENGAAASAARECRSGYVADGVCCSAACDGPCEACDLPGAAGTCVPVAKGAPARHGSCPGATGDDPCSAKTCDGVDGASCAAYVGSIVSCGAASCSDGVERYETRCDGSGACPAASSRSCDGFACDGDRCRAECTSNEHCAEGFRCDTATRACTREASCAEDGRTLVEPSGERRDCAPYRCGDGACLQRCAVTTDCVAPSVCDVGQGACVYAPPASDAAEGCAYGRRAAGGASAVGALVGAIAVAIARRRGARSVR